MSLVFDDVVQCHPKTPVFPIIQALPTERKTGWFGRIKDFFTYRRKFRVTNNYFLWSPMLQSFIFVPVGFIFDGASVPKVLNSLYSSTGMLFLGACPHDFGYRYEGLLLLDPNGIVHFKKMDKEFLDRIFEDFCSWESGMPTASKTATLGLGLFGFTGWHENRELDSDLVEDFPKVGYGG